MYRFLLLGFGGAPGTGARPLVATPAPRLFGTSFPYGPFTVNVVGSFLLGAIMHVGLTTTLISATMRLGLATGVMGGFTTYSTFNYETLEFLRDGAVWLAGLNLATTVILCVLAGAMRGVYARSVVG